MQTNDEIRRERLGMLIREAGSAADLAKTSGKSPAQISQWLTGARDSKTGRPRTMSDDIARHFEVKTNKERGWMDQPTEKSHQAASVPPNALRECIFCVLDAISASPHRSELRQLLPMLVDTNAQPYRERLQQLLESPRASPTVERVIRAKLQTETKDITPQGTQIDAGSND